MKPVIDLSEQQTREVSIRYLFHKLETESHYITNVGAGTNRYFFKASEVFEIRTQDGRTLYFEIPY